MLKITGQMDMAVDRTFTIYPEEVSQWMKNINRLPSKHVFILQAEGLDVGLHINEFRLATDGHVHLEGSLVLPDSWVNKKPQTGFYFDNEGSALWPFLQNCLQDALNYANKEGNK